MLLLGYSFTAPKCYCPLPSPAIRTPPPLSRIASLSLKYVMEDLDNLDLECDCINS